MSSKTKRGFTLIELLVVIAIIGILSSVVLASLNTARDKGRDASIQQAMQTVRVQAELVYEENGGHYGPVDDLCTTGIFADATIASAIVQIDAQDAGAANSVNCRKSTASNGGAQAWAMAAPLRDPATAGGFWCVDSTGTAEEIGAALGAGITVCP